MTVDDPVVAKVWPDSGYRWDVTGSRIHHAEADFRLGWYAKGAAFAECEVEGLGMNITTHLDLRGEHGFEDKPIHIQWLVFDVQVDSPSSADSVLAVIDWGDARCPLGAFSRRANLPAALAAISHAVSYWG